MPDETKPRSSTPWGWVLVAVGVSAHVTRFLVWPLEAPQLVAKLSSAVPMGLVMAGLQLERQRRAREGRILPGAVVFATIAFAIAVALLAAVARSAIVHSASSRPPRFTLRLPGIEVTAPNWEIRAKGERFQQGRLTANEFGGAGMFFELQWTESDPESVADLEALWKSLGFHVTNQSAASVSSHAATRFELATAEGSRHALATAWHCKNDRRSLWALSIHAAGEETATIHSEVLGGLRCHRPLDKPLPKPAFPSFAPPPGFREEMSATALAYTDGLDFYCFSGAFSGENLIQALQENTPLAQVMIAGMFQARNLELAERPTEHPGLRGPRYTWTGRATLNGTACRVAFVVWSRANEGATFFGYHAAPINMEGGDGVQVLLSAE